jgi:hypothetical protein
MEQTSSKWIRWIAIALCALALNIARRADDAQPREVARATSVSSRSAAPQSAALAGNASDPR